jgi:serine/threonine-protein kinase RsbW
MSAELHSELAETAQTNSMQFEVTLPADVSAISPVVDWVMRLVDELEYGHEKEFGIEMALREALANAILHGCKSDPAKTVECLVKGDREEGILIVVRDPGAGFNPKSLPSPTEGSKLGADHGRGIFLIHNLMDEVTHEQNGTVIRMRKF